MGRGKIALASQQRAPSVILIADMVYKLLETYTIAISTIKRTAIRHIRYRELQSGILDAKTAIRHIMFKKIRVKSIKAVAENQRHTTYKKPVTNVKEIY